MNLDHNLFALLLDRFARDDFETIFLFIVIIYFKAFGKVFKQFADIIKYFLFLKMKLKFYFR